MNGADVITAVAVIALVMALAVAWCAVVLERADPRVDATSIDWRNMARHRARFEESERARRALRDFYDAGGRE